MPSSSSSASHLTLLARQPNSIESVKALIERDTSVAGKIDDKGETALQIAAHQGNIELLNLILSSGGKAVINVPTPQEKLTPLHLASSRGHLAICQSLLEYGASVTAVDARGMSPLHHAANRGHLSIVEVLIKNRAPCNGPAVNSTSKTTVKVETPLALASFMRHADVALYLMQQGGALTTFVLAHADRHWAESLLASSVEEEGTDGKKKPLVINVDDESMASPVTPSLSLVSPSPSPAKSQVINPSGTRLGSVHTTPRGMPIASPSPLSRRTQGPVFVPPALVDIDETEASKVDPDSSSTPWFEIHEGGAGGEVPNYDDSRAEADQDLEESFRERESALYRAPLSSRPNTLGGSTPGPESPSKLPQMDPQGTQGQPPSSTRKKRGKTGGDKSILHLYPISYQGLPEGLLLDKEGRFAYYLDPKQQKEAMADAQQRLAFKEEGGEGSLFLPPLTFAPVLVGVYEGGVGIVKPISTERHCCLLEASSGGAGEGVKRSLAQSGGAASWLLARSGISAELSQPELSQQTNRSSSASQQNKVSLVIPLCALFGAHEVSELSRLTHDDLRDSFVDPALLEPLLRAVKEALGGESSTAPPPLPLSPFKTGGSGKALKATRPGSATIQQARTPTNGGTKKILTTVSSPMATRKAATGPIDTSSATSAQSPAQVLAALLIEHGLAKLLPLAAELKIIGDVQRWHHLAQAAVIWDEGSLSHLEQARLGSLLLAIGAIQDKDTQRKFSSVSQLVRTSLGSIVLYEAGCRTKTSGSTSSTTRRQGDRLLGIVIDDLGPATPSRFKIRDLLDDVIIWAAAGQIIRVSQSQAMENLRADLLPPSTSGCPVLPISAYPGAPVQLAYGWWEKQLIDPEGSQSLQHSLDARSAKGVIGILVEPTSEQATAWKVRWPDGSLCVHATGKDDLFELAHFQLHRAAGLPLLRAHIERLLSGGSRDVGSLPVVRSPLWSRQETDDEVPGSVGLALAEAGQTVLPVVWGSKCQPREAGGLPSYSPDALGAYPLCHALVPGSQVSMFTAKEGLPVEDPSSGLRGTLWSPLGLVEGSGGVRWKVIWQQKKLRGGKGATRGGGLMGECLLGDGTDSSGDYLVIPETFHLERQLLRVKVLNEVSSRSNPLTPNLNSLGRSSFWKGPTAQVVGAAAADAQPSLLGAAVRLNKAVIHLQPGMEDGPLACYDSFDVPTQLKMKRERTKKLEEAVSILESAITDLGSLKPADMHALSGYRDAKGPSRMVIDAVLVIGGAKKPSRGDNDPYAADWEAAEFRLFDSDQETFKSTIRNLATIATPSTKVDMESALFIAAVRRDYVCHATFNPNLAASECKAAEVLCRWIRAVEQYEKASRAVAEGTLKDDIGLVVRDLGPGTWRGVMVRKLGSSCSFWYDESVLLPASGPDSTQLVHSSKGSRAIVATRGGPAQGVPVTDANAAPGMLVQRLYREGAAKVSSDKAAMIGYLVEQIDQGAWSVKWPDASVGKYKCGLNGQFQLCFAQSNLLAGAPVMLSTVLSFAELQMPPIPVTDGLMITSSGPCPTPGLIRYLNDSETQLSLESSEARALETASIVVTSAGERLLVGGPLRLFELSHAIVPGAPLTIFTAKKGLRVELDTGGSADPDEAPRKVKIGTLSAPVRLVETMVKNPPLPANSENGSPPPPSSRTTSKLIDSTRVVWEVIWDHGSKGEFVVGTEASHTCLKAVGGSVTWDPEETSLSLTATTKISPSPTTIGSRHESFVRMLDPVMLVDTGNRHRNRSLARLISPLQSALQWHNQMMRELVKVWWSSSPFISAKEGEVSWMCRPDVELLVTQPDTLIVNIGGQRGRKGAYAIVDEDLTGEVTGLMTEAVSEADLDLALAVQALVRLLGSSTDYQGLHLLPANAGPSSFAPDQIVEAAIVADASKGGRSTPAPPALVPLALEVNACASRLRMALAAAALGDDEDPEEDGPSLFFGGEAPLTLSVACTFEASIAPAGPPPSSGTNSKTSRSTISKPQPSPSSPTVRRITGGDDLIPENEGYGFDEEVEQASGSSGGSLMVSIVQQELPGRQAQPSPNESLPLGPVDTLKLGCSGPLRKILLNIQRSLCALSGSTLPSSLTSGSPRSLLLVGSSPCLWIEAVELEAIAGCCPRDLPLARCRASVNRHLFDLWKACCSSKNGDVTLKPGRGGSADVSSRLLAILHVIHAKAKAALSGKAAESWSTAAREAADLADVTMLAAEEDSKEIEPFAATKTMALLRSVRLALDSLEFAQAGITQAAVYAQDAKIPSSYLFEYDDEENMLLARGAVAQSEQDVAIHTRNSFPNMSQAVTQAAERVVGSMCERLSGADTELTDALAARKAALEAFSSSEKDVKEAAGASEDAQARGKALATKLKDLAEALSLQKTKVEAKPTLTRQAAELKEITVKREEARSIKGQAQALKDRIDWLTEGRAKADSITNALPRTLNAPSTETQESMEAKVQDLATWLGDYEKRQGRLDNELSKAIHSFKSAALEVAATFPKAPRALSGSGGPPPTGAPAEKDKALERLEDLKAIAELGVQVAKKAGVSHAEQANKEVLQAVTSAVNGYGSGPIASSVASPSPSSAPGGGADPLDAAREASKVVAAGFHKVITAQAAFSIQLSNAAAAETKLADQAAQLTKTAADAIDKQIEDMQKANSTGTTPTPEGKATGTPPTPEGKATMDSNAALLKGLLAEAEKEASLARKNAEEAEAAEKANADSLKDLEASIKKLRKEILEAASEAGEAISKAASKRLEAANASRAAVTASLKAEQAVWMAHHFSPASKVPPAKTKNTAIDRGQDFSSQGVQEGGEGQGDEEGGQGKEEEEAAWVHPKGEPKDALDADRARLAVNACTEALSVLSSLSERIPPALRSAEAASRQIGGCRARVAASASRAAAEWTRTASLPCEALLADHDWYDRVKALMTSLDKRLKSDEEQSIVTEEAEAELEKEIQTYLTALEPHFANEGNSEFMAEINSQILSKLKGSKGQNKSLLGPPNQREVEDALDIFQSDEPSPWSTIVANMTLMSPATALEVIGAVPAPSKSGSLNGYSFDMACVAAGDHLPRALEAYFATREQVDASVDLKTEDEAVLRSLQCVFTIMEQVANRAAERAEKLNEKAANASTGGLNSTTKSSVPAVDPVEATATSLELQTQATAAANSLVALAAAAFAAASRQTPELAGKLESAAKKAKLASHAAKRAQTALTRTLMDSAKQLASSGSQASVSAFGSGVLATALARLALREPEVARQQQWTTQAVECLETKVKNDMDAAIAALYPPESVTEKEKTDEPEDPEQEAAEARRLADQQHKMKLEKQDKERSISAFVGSVAAEVAAAAVDLSSKLDLSSYMAPNEDEMTTVFKPRQEIIYDAHRLAKVPLLPDGTQVPPGDAPLEVEETLSTLATMVRTIAAVRAANAALMLAGGHPKVLEVEETIDTSLRGCTNVAKLQAYMLDEKAKYAEPEHLPKLIAYEEVVAASVQVAEWSLDTASLVQVSQTAENNVLVARTDLTNASRAIKELKLSVAGPTWSKAKNEAREEESRPATAAQPDLAKLQVFISGKRDRPASSTAPAPPTQPKDVETWTWELSFGFAPPCEQKLPAMDLLDQEEEEGEGEEGSVMTRSIASVEQWAKESSHATRSQLEFVNRGWGPAAPAQNVLVRDSVRQLMEPFQTLADACSRSLAASAQGVAPGARPGEQSLMTPQLLGGADLSPAVQEANLAQYKRWDKESATASSASSFVLLGLLKAQAMALRDLPAIQLPPAPPSTQRLHAPPPGADS